MANTRELRRRIKSIKNTSQITKAMQMVASTKMRRAQNQALGGRPYSENLYASLGRLFPRIDPEAHPLLTGNDNKTAGVILLSTDKGLVGALNTNLIRTVLNLQTGFASVVFYTVGSRGRAFIVRTGKDLKADFENMDTVSFRQAKQLSKMVIDAFMSGEIGQAILVYPHFISTLRQETKMVKILPISAEVLVTSHPGESRSDSIGSNKKDSIASLPNDNGREFLFEPSPDELLDFLLVHHIEEQIYQALLETKASEHSARMVAMKNATDNALELVDDLTLAYNQTRQASITTELLEIATAQVAME